MALGRGVSFRLARGRAGLAGRVCAVVRFVVASRTLAADRRYPAVPGSRRGSGLSPLRTLPGHLVLLQPARSAAHLQGGGHLRAAGRLADDVRSRAGHSAQRGHPLSRAPAGPDGRRQGGLPDVEGSSALQRPGCQRQAGADPGGGAFRCRPGSGAGPLAGMAGGWLPG